VALGWSLRTNSGLTHLDLTHTALAGRAALVLAVGTRDNATLRRLILDANPLGAAGRSDSLHSKRGACPL
jgi:hypothetical protein